MTLKQKLIANMALTSIGIIVIAGFSLAGMRFVQDKLHTLTEQSTPYQLKVYEQQRSLQEHIGNLLRFSVVATPQDLSATKQKSDKTLDSIENTSRELASFKGNVNQSDSGLAGLKEITVELENSAAARITAHSDVQKALKLADESLLKIGDSLKGVDNAMKRSQQKTVTDISAANESFKRSSTKIKNTQQVLGYLNDIKLSLTELSSAEGAEDVTFIRNSLDTALKSISAAAFLNAEKGTKQANDLSEVLAAFHKTLPGMCDSFSASLSPHDEVKRAKALQELSKALKLTNRSIKMLAESIEAANALATGDGKRLDATLATTVTVSAQLAKNSELVALGAELKALIRDLFSAQKQADLEKIKQDIENVFSRTAVLRQNLKSADGIAAVGTTFGSIHETLFGKGGAYEKLSNIVKVTAQATQAAERLKGIVDVQQKHGETGAEKARTAQADAIKSVNTVFRSSIILTVSLAVTVLVLAVFFSRHLLKSVMNPVNDLSRFASRFGNGDFSIRLDAKKKDEFGGLAADFNSSSDTLTGIVSELTGAINKMVTSVRDLTGAVTTIDSTVESQAAFAHESATANEEMTATVTSVAQSANDTATLTAESQHAARTGQKAVIDTVQAITEIAAAVSEAVTVMNRLAESSGRIGGVVETINNIADQTNLLALNAAIEAARAGEQGRGFAVVANEVRVLATRTTEATKEIAVMVTTIQSDIDITHKAMTKGSERVETGVELAGAAQNCLNRIVTACDGASQMVTQIATTTEEQAATAIEISFGVGKISDMANQTKGAAHQIAVATKELEVLAGDLGRRASWFK
jgi:methyl-accepting chemotaxis protein